MASLRCHNDSDCNKTHIIRNFHLYIKQLWKPFFHIFTHCDVVNAQTSEAPQKIQSSHLKLLLKGHYLVLTLNYFGLLSQACII